jgi:hypothetical protein
VPRPNELTIPSVKVVFRYVGERTLGVTSVGSCQVTPPSSDEMR